MKQAPIQLEFENESERLALYAEAVAHYEAGSIPKERIDLGKKFKELITQGYIVKNSVRFLGEEIGDGFFANEPLEEGAFVGEYVGCVRQNNRHGEMNNYLYSYPQTDEIGRNYVIDAENGSHTRLINHSFQPNLIAKYAFVDGYYHLILLTLREIQVDEQLAYNYGKKYWIVREPPKPLF
ncbi:MAG: hypothetical protein K940chlam2_00108 [Chlamydiae bacterium]|nr:hypothetical protein [Chlamydiota bacterium]